MDKWICKTDFFIDLGILKDQVVNLSYHNLTNKFIVHNYFLLDEYSVNEYFIKVSDHRDIIINIILSTK